MKKTFILVLCLSMFIGQRSVLAKPMEIEEKLFQETLQQSKNVTGLLTDEYGNPIIGATILVKGTTQGVISDINGRFPFGLQLVKHSPSHLLVMKTLRKR